MSFNLTLKPRDFAFNRGQRLLVTVGKFCNALCYAVAYCRVQRVYTADKRTVPLAVKEQFRNLLVRQFLVLFAGFFVKRGFQAFQ
jgi:hypothetical protein